jgi:secreted trypsin-like serine protease
MRTSTSATRTWRRMVLACALASGGLAACQGAEDDEHEVARQPIFNGNTRSDVGPLGMPLILSGVTGQPLCSAVVYNSYWVLTAAHCFPGTADANHDNKITSAELPIVVGPLAVDSTGRLGNVIAFAVYKHPQAKFGSSEGLDIAMIFLSPGSSGVATSVLSSRHYTNGRLNLYGADTRSLSNDLGTHSLNAFGWGAIGPNFTDGSLHEGMKQGSLNCARICSTGYFGSTINGAGTGCFGDSGGPDFMSTGLSFVLTGIHSQGDGSCRGGIDSNMATPAFRPWTDMMASSCPATTVSGPCHF